MKPNEALKILMLSHLYPSRIDSVGGNFVHSQVKALKDQGCDVQVIVPVPYAPFPLNKISAKWKKYSQIPARDTIDGIDVLYPKIIRTPGARLFQYAGDFYYHALKSLIPRLHQQTPLALIHAQVGYPDGWAAAKIAEELNLPLVITCHGQELQIIAKRSPKLKLLVLEALNRANRVIVTGPKLHRLARELGIPDHKLETIPNGVNRQQPGILPPDLQEKKKNKYTILSVAHLIEQKGIQHVIEAMAVLKKQKPSQGFFYIVVGDGPMKATLQDLALQHSLTESIYFAGQIPHEQIGAWYHQANLFVLPSRDEAFGMVYLEAMQAGLPVIGCQDEGILPLITEKGAGLAVPYNNPSSLAAALAQVIDDQSGTMERLAVQLAAQFSWEENGQRLREVYRVLTGKWGQL